MFPLGKWGVACPTSWSCEAPRAGGRWHPPGQAEEPVLGRLERSRAWPGLSAFEGSSPHANASADLQEEEDAGEEQCCDEEALAAGVHEFLREFSAAPSAWGRSVSRASALFLYARRALDYSRICVPITRCAGFRG